MVFSYSQFLDDIRNKFETVMFSAYFVFSGTTVFIFLSYSYMRDALLVVIIIISQFLFLNRVTEEEVPLIKKYFILF